jgi:hypothetical protein
VVNHQDRRQYLNLKNLESKALTCVLTYAREHLPTLLSVNF